MSHILSPGVDIDFSGNESLNCLDISCLSSCMEFCLSLREREGGGRGEGVRGGSEGEEGRRMEGERGRERGEDGRETKSEREIHSIVHIPEIEYSYYRHIPVPTSYGTVFFVTASL